VIAIDTNVLVHAHREESPWHAAASKALAGLGARRWALPWPCVHEFLAIVTHPRIFAPPTPIEDALATVDGWLSSSSVVLLGEGEGYWESLARIVRAAHVVGPQLHDARIAALCIHHGVDELWSADRDFSRFAELRVKNPLLG